MIHRASLTGYCIPRGIKLQKLLVFPHFCPQNPHFGGMNTEKAFSSLKRKILKLAYYQKCRTNSNQILHNDRDHQVLFVGGASLLILGYDATASSNMLCTSSLCMMSFLCIIARNG